MQNFYAQGFQQVRTNCFHNYEYLSLQDPLRSIRIAVLQPGIRSEPIKINILQQNLSRSNKYTALSYVWGPPSVTVPIQIEDSRFHITRNLESALRHLRDSTKPRSLWIDALCINQEDMRERETQVSIMRSIYSHAEEIIAWLGPASGDSDLAMDIMSGRKADILFQTPETRTPSTAMDFHRGLVALRRLYNRAWWTRVWIIQEATIRTRPVQIHCGFKYVPWDSCVKTLAKLRALVVAAQTAYKSRSTSQREFLIYDELRQGILEILRPANFLVSQRYHWDKCFHYTTQLGQVRGFGASDPRDIVWVAEALSGPFASQDTAVKPNYSLTVRQTFLYSVQQSFKYDDLHFLEHCDLQSWSSLDLPTFVPNWRNPPTRQILRLPLGRFNACHGRRPEVKGFLNSTKDFSRQEKPSFLHPESEHALYAKGVLLDEITHRFSLSPIILYYGRGLEQILAGLFSRVLPGSSNAADTVRLILDVIAAGQIHYSPEAEDVVQEISAIYEKYSAKIKQGGVAYGFSKDIRQQLKKIPQVEQQAIRLWDGRRVTQLGNYSVALSPGATRPGDMVCILFGLKVPIILRPNGEGAYQVVGECYVPGIMYGEAVTMFESTQKRVKTFKIV